MGLFTSEQTPFIVGITMKLNRNVNQFALGRTSMMKFRLALLLLSGATLLAAMPAWADNYAVPVSETHAGFDLDSSIHEGFRAELFSSAGSDFSSPKSSGDFSSGDSNSDVHLDNRLKLHSYRGGSGESFTPGNQSDGGTNAVPEPEAVSLLLLGLAAIGSLTLRRKSGVNLRHATK
jgi:hypothetical protein